MRSCWKHAKLLCSEKSGALDTTVFWSVAFGLTRHWRTSLDRFLGPMPHLAAAGATAPANGPPEHLRSCAYVMKILRQACRPCRPCLPFPPLPALPGFWLLLLRWDLELGHRPSDLIQLLQIGNSAAWKILDSLTRASKQGSDLDLLHHLAYLMEFRKIQEGSHRTRSRHESSSPALIKDCSALPALEVIFVPLTQGSLLSLLSLSLSLSPAFGLQKRMLTLRITHGQPSLLVIRNSLRYKGRAREQETAFSGPGVAPWHSSPAHPEALRSLCFDLEVVSTSLCSFAPDVAEIVRAAQLFAICDASYEMTELQFDAA